MFQKDEIILHEDADRIVELLLTVEIFNKERLTLDYLPKDIRKNYWDNNKGELKSQLDVFGKDVECIYNINPDLIQRVIKELPFIDYIEINSRLKLTNFNVAMRWFLNRDKNYDKIKKNPVLAYYCSKKGLLDIDYKTVLSENVPILCSREWKEYLINKISNDEKLSPALPLVKIFCAEDMLLSMKDLVLTEEEIEKLNRVKGAINNKKILKRLKLYDVGKLLFVGPPGTGKTTIARLTTEFFSLPLVEIRISMIVDQYLGETSKNIDRVFELARNVAPCILFIDEFDFIAKTRTSDEHSAVKRAVNTLIKNIDEINLINDEIILIGATNHPQLLDIAIWRRFDDVVFFPLPSDKEREDILRLLLTDIKGDFNIKDIARITDGFTGSDLRLIVKKTVLNILSKNNKEEIYIMQKDLINSVDEIKKSSEMREDIGRYFGIE